MQPWIHEYNPVCHLAGKLISWVRQSLSSLAASCFITASTLTDKPGSRAEVGSSKSIILGFIRPAHALLRLAAADRPTDGKDIHPSYRLRPTFSRSDPGNFCRSFREIFGAPSIGAVSTFSSAVIWGKRLNLWNTMPSSEQSSATFFLPEFSQRVAPGNLFVNQLTINIEPPFGNTLQMVNRRMWLRVKHYAAMPNHLERISEGRLYIDGGWVDENGCRARTRWKFRQKKWPALVRSFGMVFQRFNLFPIWRRSKMCSPRRCWCAKSHGMSGRNCRVTP